MTNRIKQCFARLAEQNRPALMPFITAGDPDLETSFKILSNLPAAGADIIELGMPFSDPMADGPAVQLANQRALSSGMTLRKTLALVKQFRQKNQITPIILMGYFNLIYHFGVKEFLTQAQDVGIDGLIIVDLPVEEDNELCHPARTQGLDWIRLATPTTSDQRLPLVLNNASGFIYYVSIAGVTGTASANLIDVEVAVQRIRKHTNLPIVVGFGIKTPEQVKATGAFADGVVVGSAIVDIIKSSHERGDSQDIIVDKVKGFVTTLAQGLSK